MRTGAKEADEEIRRSSPSRSPNTEGKLERRW
ncbi:hypothetical protein J2S21_004076 [Peribacillus cavernae]|nr:hypothetical protein [Peribacillus cavernae]